ncbi:OmpP1/FadL family transporter [Thalassolituus oleivorans]|uniref:OmpP1/FadL family transporter n=2 Tax=Thalassolituus oleivorans TaxID=187493 RepID=UPI0009FB3F03|nr:outer membrane protein transport protein [Thalassolituus oleivorans]MCA6127852.1 aromatic hydrocarbon degradation protein [Thalassolituus oleivorans 4BN06-13]
MRILLLVALLVPSLAKAELVQNLFIDTKAMSLGNAVTADPTGIMDIHFNPAGLTKLEGRQVQVQLQGVMLRSEASFSLPNGYDYDQGEADLLPIHEDPVLTEGKSHSNVAIYIPGYGLVGVPLPILALPSAGISINPPGSKFTFANAVYAPMAAGFSKGDDDPGRYQAKTIALQRLTYLSPSFGYKVTDEFSVGAGLLFSHQAVALEQDLRAPNVLIGVLEELQDAFGCFDAETGEPTGNDPLAPLLTLCGGNVGPFDDVGTLKINTTESLSPSFNLGLLWEPNGWFKFGVGYQSEATSQLKGDYDLEYTDEFADFFRNFRSSIIGAIGGAIFSLPTGNKRERGFVTTELTYPQHFQAGVAFQYFDVFHLNLDLGWTDYDKWDELYFEFDRDVSFLSTARTLSPDLVTSSTLTMPLNFKSVWNYKVGASWDLNSRIQLRAGLEPRKSSIPDDSRSLQAPIGFARLYSVGLGYQWDLDTVVDLSLSFMKSVQHIRADPQNAENFDDYPNSSNSLNRNCLTCVVTNPYPGLDIDTKLTIGAAGISFRTKF